MPNHIGSNQEVAKDIINSRQFKNLIIRAAGVFTKLNEHNRWQNRDAEIEAIILGIDGTLESQLNEAVRYSKKYRYGEWKISILNDVTRLAFAAIFLAVSNHVKDGNDNLDDIRWNLMFVAGAAQGLLSFAGARLGYMSAALGHKLEWTNAFLDGLYKVLDSGEQQELKNLGNKERHKLSAQDFTMKGYEFGGHYRHPGTVANVLAAILGASVLYIRLIEKPEREQTSSRYAEFASIAAPLISMMGKMLSAFAADDRRRKLRDGHDGSGHGINSAISDLERVIGENAGQENFKENFLRRLENYVKDVDKIRDDSLKEIRGSCAKNVLMELKRGAYFAAMKSLWGMPYYLYSISCLEGHARHSQRSDAIKQVDELAKNQNDNVRGFFLYFLTRGRGDRGINYSSRGGLSTPVNSPSNSSAELVDPAHLKNNLAAV